MMCRALIVVLICFGLQLPGVSLYAQKADSGGPESLTLTLSDTLAINEGLQQSGALSARAPDSCILLAGQLLQRSYAQKYTLGVIRSLLQIGASYLNKGAFKESIRYYNLAYPFCVKYRPISAQWTASYYNNMGIAYTHMGVFDSGVYYFYKGVGEVTTGKATDATIALKLYTNLGGLWSAVGSFQNALRYFKLAEGIAVQSGDSVVISSLLLNIGTTYGVQYEKAFSYFKRSYEIAVACGNTHTGYNALLNMAGIYNHWHKEKAALALVEQAYDISKKSNSLHGIVLSQMTLAEIHLDAGRYATAEALLSKASKQSIAAGLRTDLDYGYQLQSRLYAATRRYDSAYYYEHLYATYKDSVMKKQHQGMNALLLHFYTSEKDKEIVKNQLQLSAQERKLQRKNLWIGSVTTGAILLLVLLTFIGLNFRHRLKNMLQKREIEHMKAAIGGEEKERSRIARDLHDGLVVQFSAVKMLISSLRNQYPGLSDSETYTNALKQQSNAIRELRQTAHNLMPDLLLDGGLHEALNYFCHNMQQTSGRTVVFQCLGTLPVADAELELTLYRLVQELVQNAIKHARADKIMVQLNYFDRNLSLTVEDDGLGMDAHQKREKGMGLKNIEERIRLFNGQIDMRSEPGKGTSVQIEMDYKK